MKCWQDNSKFTLFSDIRQVAVATGKIVILFGLIAFIGTCSHVPTPPAREPIIPLSDLLALLPAEQPRQADLIFAEMMRHSRDSLQRLIDDLSSERSEVRIRAEYALHGLAVYAGSGRRPGVRQEYLALLKNALQNQIPQQQAVFLLDQWALCGDAVHLSDIRFALLNPQLQEAAIRAVMAVGGYPAGEILLEAMEQTEDALHPALIKALGEIPYEPAAALLSKRLDKNYPSRNTIILTALANIAYPPAETLLKAAAKKEETYVPLYLKFITRLVEQGQKDRAVTLLQEIFIDDQGDYKSHHRGHALSLLVEFFPEKANDYLLMALSDSSAPLRARAWRLAQERSVDELLMGLINGVDSFDSTVQTELIRFLGEQRWQAGLPYVQKAVQSTDPLIRKAAIRALARLSSTEFLHFCRELLMNNPAEEDLAILRELLLSLSDVSLLYDWFAGLADFPGASRVVLIGLLKERRNEAFRDAVALQLNFPDAAVQQAVLDYLTMFGSDEQIPLIIPFLNQEVNRELKQAARQAIAAIVQRSSAPQAALDAFARHEFFSGPGMQVSRAEVLRLIGSERALQIVRNDLAEALPPWREPLQRIIINWPNTNALEALLEIAAREPQESLRILAIRSAVKLISESAIPAPRAYLLYRQAMNAAFRAEEKRLILSALAGVQTPSALGLILEQLKNPQISYEAFLAAINFTEQKEGDKGAFRAGSITTTLIEAISDEALQNQIKTYRLDRREHNIPPQGFTALFNGFDLDGWQGLVENPPRRAQMSRAELARAQQEADQVMRQHWQVIDGVLYFNGKGFHNLCTVKEYTDFELLVDWMIEKGGDSGIYLRGVPQVQIWDPQQHGVGSGGLYNNQIHPSTPLMIADRPAGQWNTMRIIMRGQQVTVYLNDSLVVDDVVLENYWERDKPIYASGPIELQAHNSPLYFRNIFIREIDDTSAALFSGDLFNGGDLNGWQVIGGEADSWKVHDGILFTEGRGGGWLSTDKEYGDFRLELEFKVPPGGNSGVFIRAPHAGDPAYTGMEIQILDDYADKYKHLKPWQYTGSIYRLKPPQQRVSKKAGEWQHMIITCKGPLIKVVLNGIDVVEANLIDFMDHEKDHPGIKRRQGYIGLQNHSSFIEYRKIHFTELK